MLIVWSVTQSSNGVAVSAAPDGRRVQGSIMSFENATQKQLNEMERLVRELLEAMRKAKYQDETLSESLRKLEAELSKLRRERFDATNSEYNSY
jgi:Skp family chaperone for outer membrane proteins